ncbi:MAG: alpha/beta fold hydrolase [Nanoarchaeota archaeon]
MVKTIFVYGFKGYNKQIKSAKEVFGNLPLICFEYNSNLNQPLEKIAEELSNFVNSNTKKKEKINLIGVSAGGIIATYYTKFLSPHKIHKLATICSPFRGTYLSFFYSKKKKGVRELIYNSEFLKNLNSRKLNKYQIINFYSYLDPLVPGNSGKGENSFHTWNFFHFLIQNDKKILRKIKCFFHKK